MLTSNSRAFLCSVGPLQPCASYERGWPAAQMPRSSCALMHMARLGMCASSCSSWWGCWLHRDSGLSCVMLCIAQLRPSGASDS